MGLKSSMLTSCDDSSDTDISAYVDDLQRRIKRKLQGQVFIGSYKEKRFCQRLNVYRDVVTIHRNECDFTKILQEVIRELLQVYNKEIITTSITGPGVPNESDESEIEYAIWTNLKDIPVGVHWFQIQKVSFLEFGIQVKVKYLRSYEAEKTNVSGSSSTENSFILPDINEIIAASINSFGQAFQNLSKNLNSSNMITGARFLLVFLLVSVTGMFNFLQFFSEFLLKFIREMSIVIQKLTPMMIVLLETFGKIIGGLYILILALWRGHPSPNMALEPPPYYNQRSGFKKRNYNFNRNDDNPFI